MVIVAVRPPGSRRRGRSGLSFAEAPFAVAIENNRPSFWLSEHLGQSSLDVTSNVYGHFEKATRRREAEAMAGGVRRVTSCQDGT